MMKQPITRGHTPAWLASRIKSGAIIAFSNLRRGWIIGCIPPPSFRFPSARQKTRGKSGIVAVTNEEVKFPIRPEMTELSFIFRREKTKPGGNESQIMISYSRKIIRKRVVIITNPIITKRRVGGLMKTAGKVRRPQCHHLISHCSADECVNNTHRQPTKSQKEEEQDDVLCFFFFPPPNHPPFAAHIGTTRGRRGILRQSK